MVLIGAPARRATADIGVSQTPGSFTLRPVDGAYSRLPVWRSRTAWCDMVLDTLRTPEGEQLRRRRKVAPDTLLRVAFCDAKSADSATGRGVATSHETVAEQLGMSAKTVQRARQLLEDLGLAVTVVAGRYLTRAERAAARRVHGSYQDRAASTRALVMPAPVENVQLPPVREVKTSSRVSKRTTKRALARTLGADASRRPLSMKVFAATLPEVPRDLDVQWLARGLDGTRWRLTRGRHIGSLCRVLERHAMGGRGWTAGQLIGEISRSAAQLHIKILPLEEQRDPLRYFAWLLRQTIPYGAAAPRESDEQRRQRFARQAAAAAAEQQLRARLRAEQDEIDAILAAMHTRHPARAGRR